VRGALRNFRDGMALMILDVRAIRLVVREDGLKDSPSHRRHRARRAP
jgi:hypothetical protein